MNYFQVMPVSHHSGRSFFGVFRTGFCVLPFRQHLAHPRYLRIHPCLQCLGGDEGVPVACPEILFLGVPHRAHQFEEAPCVHNTMFWSGAPGRIRTAVCRHRDGAAACAATLLLGHGGIRWPPLRSGHAPMERTLPAFARAGAGMSVEVAVPVPSGGSLRCCGAVPHDRCKPHPEHRSRRTAVLPVAEQPYHCRPSVVADHLALRQAVLLRKKVKPAVVRHSMSVRAW